MERKQGSPGGEADTSGTTSPIRPWRLFWAGLSFPKQKGYLVRVTLSQDHRGQELEASSSVNRVKKYCHLGSYENSSGKLQLKLYPWGIIPKQSSHLEWPMIGVILSSDENSWPASEVASRAPRWNLVRLVYSLLLTSCSWTALPTPKSLGMQISLPRNVTSFREISTSPEAPLISLGFGHGLHPPLSQHWTVTHGLMPPSPPLSLWLLQVLFVNAASINRAASSATFFSQWAILEASVLLLP